MKLHEVKRGSLIRLLPEPVEEGMIIHPPCHREFDNEEQLEFKHIDGMYSLCYDNAGSIVHLVAWAEVEVIRDGPKVQDT